MSVILRPEKNERFSIYSVFEIQWTWLFQLWLSFFLNIETTRERKLPNIIIKAQRLLFFHFQNDRNPFVEFSYFYLS